MVGFTDKDVTATELFVFFWRGWPSQWFRSTFTLDGIEYNCCEQYMMADKARIFGDKDTLQQILKVTSPKEQKALGRKVRGFEEGIWNSVCRAVVYTANLAKFRENADLAVKLLETAQRTIVEASPVDPVWGIGLAVDNPDVFDSSKWPGKNWLGIALMQVRASLRSDAMDPVLKEQLERRVALAGAK